MRVTINNINKALKKSSQIYPQLKDVELVKGNGYFYFAGGESSGWYSSGVYVNALWHHGGIDAWVQEALNLSRK